MSRHTGPKNRIARRFGANLFGRARNPLLHKQHPPGHHGARRRKKSDFGLQLDEQQKLKAVYGMLRQKQLINYYKKAVTTPGKTPDVLLGMLESRLDTFVFRMKLAPTIFAAQQLVAHGHIKVDGKKVDRRSFLVKPGMVVSLREKSQKMPLIVGATENTARETPAYMELRGPFEAKMAMAPERDQIEFPVIINIDTVCEFLAHTS